MYSLPRECTESLNFKVGNGENISTEFAVTVPLTIQGNKIELTCLATNNLGGYDIMIGAKSVRELQYSIDFDGVPHLKIKARSIPLKPVYDTFVKHGQAKTITLHGKILSFMKNSEVWVIANHSMRNMCPTSMFASCKKRKIRIKST